MSHSANPDNIILELIEAGLTVPFKPEKNAGFGCRYFTVRKLNESDVNVMIELQEKVYKMLNEKSLFVFTDREECVDSVNNDICFGVFCENRMIAASILVLNRETERNIGSLLGYEPSECATLDSTFVLPEFRGHGIQRFLIELRLNLAAKSGASIAFATVSPDNSFSLYNLATEGFTICNEMPLYGGLDRFIVMKRIK